MASTPVVVGIAAASTISGYIGGYFMSPSSSTKNIKTEGEIQNKVVVNEKPDNNLVIYILIGVLALVLLIIGMCNFFLFKKFNRKIKATKRVKYNPSFEEVVIE